ncbi:MAG: hypothetical protein D6790_16275 [Caldilineae bacterium]|nr:MAG: hypothetical protein D6790_16275 [Caldilineae bacterium]
MDDQRRLQETEPTLHEIFASECDAFAESLYLCAQAEMAGESDLSRFADFLRHRNQCRRCQESYADVKLLLEMEAQEQASMSVATPRQGEQARLAERGRAWIVETTTTGARLIIQLAQLVLGEDQPGLALRRPREEASPLGELTVTPAQMGYGVEVRLRLLPDVEDPALALLAAEISLPDRWPDFSGVSVILHLPDGEQRRAITGPTGIVRFPGLVRDDLPAMRCVVELP